MPSTPICCGAVGGTAGPCRRRPPSGSTGVVRRALTVGVRWGWLAANPAFIAMPPRSTRRAISPPAPTDVARLIAAAGSDLGEFLLLAATTGARRGELCGLRWSDIDLTEQLVEVTRAVIIVDGNCTGAAAA